MFRRLAVLSALPLLLAGCGLTDAREAAIAEANTKPLTLEGNLRPGLVGLFDYPSTGWEQSEDFGSGVEKVDTSLLAAIGLHDDDLVDGSVVEFMPDGDKLGVATLDFCSADYPSESLRIARAQTAAYAQDGTFSGLSTEVVAYVDAEAAQQALAEVVAARKACPTGKPVTAEDGHTVTFEFHGAPGPSNTTLMPADARLIVHTTMLVDKEPRRAFLVYQVRGRLLVGFYASSLGSAPYGQTELDALYGLVGKITERLQRASSTLVNGQQSV